MPEDIYHVVIEDINLETRAVWEKPNEEEDVLKFQFVVLDKGEYEGRKLWHKVRPTMSSGWDGGSASWLFQIFNAAKGEPTDAQMLGLSTDEINSLIGEQLRVSVKNKPGKGKNLGRTFDYIEGVIKAKEVLPAPKLATKSPEVRDKDIPIIEESEFGEAPPIEESDLPF